MKRLVVTQDLVRNLRRSEKAMVHVGDGDTNCNWRTWNAGMKNSKRRK